MIRVESDWTSTTQNTAVIETVAIASDREPTGIEPLNEVVDTDALDALVRSNGADPIGEGTTVTFEFVGQSVTVHGGGSVVVHPVEPRLDEA